MYVVHEGAYHYPITCSTRTSHAAPHAGGLTCSGACMCTWCGTCMCACLYMYVHVYVHGVVHECVHVQGMVCMSTCVYTCVCACSLRVPAPCVVWFVCVCMYVDVSLDLLACSPAWESHVNTPREGQTGGLHAGVRARETLSMRRNMHDTFSPSNTPPLTPPTRCPACKTRVRQHGVGHVCADD